MILSAPLFLFTVIALTSAKKLAAPRTEPVQFCENYITCLSSLKAKQQECLAFPSESMDLRGSSTMRAAGNANTNTTRECTKRKRKELQRELAELHIRRTEVLKTCIKENARRARSILNPQKEKKCLANSEKLVTFVELAKHGKSNNKKSKQGGKSEGTKERGNKRKSESKKSTTPNDATAVTTTTATATVMVENGGTTGGLEIKRRAKRRAALALNKKHNAKTCKRAKKSMSRKCQQISKCCSLVNECQLLADAIDTQIIELKMEFKAPSCTN